MFECLRARRGSPGRFYCGEFFFRVFYFRYRAHAGFARSTRNDTRTNETILRVRKIIIKKSLRKPIIFTRRRVVRRNTPRSARRKRSEKKNGDLRKGLYCANKQFLRLRRKDYAFFVRGYRFFTPPPTPSPSRSVSLLLRLRGRPTIVINNASARIAEIKKKNKTNTNSPFVPGRNPGCRTGDTADRRPVVRNFFRSLKKLVSPVLFAHAVFININSVSNRYGSEDGRDKRNFIFVSSTR